MIGLHFHQKNLRLVLEENYGLADELKVVVVNKHDLVWAKEQAQYVSEATLLYLQPEWSKKDNVHKMMFNYLNSHEGEGMAYESADSQVFRALGDYSIYTCSNKN